MDHGLDVERRVTADLIEMSKKLDIPLLATNDLHYVKAVDAVWHEAMLALQSGAQLSDPRASEGQKGRFAFDGNDYYVKSANEMRELFGDELAEACDNTLLVAERVAAADIKMAPASLMPKFPTPEGVTEEELLTRNANEGLNRRFKGNPVPDEYRTRLAYELDVIQSMGFPGYFLVVADFVQWAKDNGIAVGSGRGCLSGDTRVATPEGFKNIKNVKVGDKVFDETGTAVIVPEVFEYDCDEDLIEIKAFFGGAGNKMTSDHKVLVSKANRTTNKHKLAQGYRFEPEILEPEWIRADEVEVDDLVVVPKLQYPETTTWWSFNPVYVAAATQRSPLSSREIGKAVGVSSVAVKRYVNKGGKVNSPAATLIREHLTDVGASIQDCLNIRTTTVTAATGELPASYEAGQFFGMFISNGWLVTRNPNQIGFAQNRTADTGYYPQLIRDLFGLELSAHNHATNDLRQYDLNHGGITNLVRTLFPDYEHTAHTKYIPQEFMTAPEEFRLGLLHGLWYGDGCHSSKTVYSTVSERLADDVAMLLLSLGLPAGIKSQTRTDTRPEFAGTRTEYKVATAHYFDTDTMSNSGVGHDGRFTYLRVREVNTVPAEGKVYDFTVPGKHSYVTDSYIVHNSVGGSLLAWALRITEVDPIRHDLLFERFLNPERVSMPDIDLDFDDTRRTEVIDYVRNKYGEENVAHIATFTVLKAKSALRDSARVHGAPYQIGDLLSKAFPNPVMGQELALDSALIDVDHERFHEASKFRAIVKQDPFYGKIVATARKFEGLVRGYGMHAAGVIISPEPIDNHVPLMRAKTTAPMMTAYDYPTCESLGLVKMDFLGLSTLGTITEAIRQIETNTGEVVDLDHLIETLDDEATYELLSSGNTLGVFQLDSAPMQALLRRMSPDRFNDISAVLALYRPGPMAANAHNDYADRKTGRKGVIPIHPEFKGKLDGVLGDTHGLIVFQEQVMRIAQEVAGYSLGQADLLRRAMGKKKKEAIEAEFIPFRDGARANGYGDEAIQTLWDILVPFSEYAFNASHSAAYGLTSYITAYLKTHHPVEFMAGLLTTNATSPDKLAVYLTECRRMGVKVLVPDVNTSGLTYTATKTGIRVGLLGVRNVGDGPANAIIAERELNGPYTSLVDFLARTSGRVSKRVAESLIDAGGFDALYKNRAALADQLPKAAEIGNKARAKARATEKKTGAVVAPDYSALQLVSSTAAPWTPSETLAREKEALGLYISGHPLTDILPYVEGARDTTVAELLMADESWDGRRITISGVITGADHRIARSSGNPWANVTIDDMTGTYTFPVFSKTYQAASELLRSGQVIIASGTARWESEEDSVRFMVNKVSSIATVFLGGV
jgi:DNA polymerase III alpha subunit